MAARAPPFRDRQGGPGGGRGGSGGHSFLQRGTGHILGLNEGAFMEAPHLEEHKEQDTADVREMLYKEVDREEIRMGLGALEVMWAIMVLLKVELPPREALDRVSLVSNIKVSKNFNGSRFRPIDHRPFHQGVAIVDHGLNQAEQHETVPPSVKEPDVAKETIPEFDFKLETLVPSPTGLISISGEKIAAKVVQTELAKLVRADWSWEALPREENYFLVTFSSEEELKRMEDVEFRLKNHGVSLSISKWQEAGDISPLYELDEVWVHISMSRR
uniref:DUF4283 domain-containing protein n=1 Tax=Oryza brachyantha TaxID=4533 RepID=J3N6I2_ORYBR